MLEESKYAFATSKAATDIRSAGLAQCNRKGIAGTDTRDFFRQDAQCRMVFILDIVRQSAQRSVIIAAPRVNETPSRQRTRMHRACTHGLKVFVDLQVVHYLQMLWLVTFDDAGRETQLTTDILSTNEHERCRIVGNLQPLSDHVCVNGCGSFDDLHCQWMITPLRHPLAMGLQRGDTHPDPPAHDFVSADEKKQEVHFWKV